ncbi:MAG: heavy-metal-associated domain-containing protein [Deltaproteobacteria bacterium]|nr:heavy-metal-associated domain-containing protein [Deltaproteobacteria bacterium]
MEKVKGVYQVKTDTARHKATVWYDGRSTNVQQFVKALKRANFEVERTVQIK